MQYTREEFIDKYGNYVSNAVQDTGIHEGTLFSQAFLESGIKKHTKSGSKLSREANNFFGIKCHKAWKGKRYNIDTGEWSKERGSYIEPKACFRAYDSPKDSIDDYIKFLKENSRYEKAGVFKAKDVKEQAQRLKNAGYATDPNYAEKINGVYMGIKNYVDKYKTYGGKKIISSFFHSPTKFIKRNWQVVLISTIILSGIVGIGYVVIKNRGK